MADTFTTVTRQSWLGRIGSAVKGALVGLVLFLVAFPLLFWNEGRAVKRHRTLREGAGLVVSASTQEVNPGNEGKLVHIAGDATTDETLADPVFGVSATAIKLRRNVEMYQWREDAQRETRKKLGGGSETVTTYRYSKAWDDELIRSASFKEPAGHANPASMPYASETFAAREVDLGAFRLSPSLVNLIGNHRPLAPDATARLPAALAGRAHPAANGYYIGADPASPRVGDVRVRFDVVLPGPVSVVSGQCGDTFQPYPTRAGGTIELLETGVVGPDAMFRRAQDRNRLLTWGLRLLGFVLMAIGLGMVFKPLSVLADVVPLFGSIVAAGTGAVVVLTAGACALTTVAVAWVAYRPVLGGALLAAVIALLALLGRKLRRRAG